MTKTRNLLVALSLLGGAALGCDSEDISGYETYPPPARQSAHFGPEGQVRAEPRSNVPTPGNDRYAPPDQPVGRMPGATVPSVSGTIVPPGTEGSTEGAPTAVPVPPAADEQEPSGTQAVPLPPH